MSSTENNSPFIDDSLKTDPNAPAPVESATSDSATENNAPFIDESLKTDPNAPAPVEAASSESVTENNAPFIDDSLKTAADAPAPVEPVAAVSPNVQSAVPQTNRALNDRTLELLAERAQVEIEKIATGELTVRKEIRSQTVNVPITLRQELLIIEHHPGAPLAHLAEPNDGTRLVQIDQAEVLPHTIVNLNGQPHDLDQAPLTLVLSQEVAKINVHTVVAERVQIGTEQKQFDKQLDVTVRHEELVTEQVDYETPKVLSSETLQDLDIQTKP